MVDESQNEWVNAFRQKSNYMKGWKPASTPSNRDRLELYALHKQSMQGDAPSTLPNNSAAGDRAKFQAWRSKSGIAKNEAMRLYCLEADRQVRVYGFQNGTTGAAYAALSQSPSNSIQNNTGNHQQHDSTQQHQHQQPRGLAAIPLLCAAASESRQAYLRRLAQTPIAHAWWRRQEPLTATPGTLGALPEHALIALASLVEYISLIIQGDDTNNTSTTSSTTTTPTDSSTVLGVLPIAVVQSFLWPTHNSLLALWMGLILVATAWTAVWELLQTLLLGSRRTGRSLPSIWQDQVQFAAQSVHTLVEAHQPLSARLVGLLLQPVSVIPSLGGFLFGSIIQPQQQQAQSSSSSSSPPVWGHAVVYCAGMLLTWWYYFIVLPVIVCGWMVAAVFMAGQCFALIELAGV